MDKKTLAQLERLFEAEIDGREISLPPRTAAKMEKLGLIQRVPHTNRDRFGTFTWETHALTHAGRWAYCESCPETESFPTT